MTTKSLLAGYSALKQEIKDFKEEIIPRLERIDSKISYTNGKISDTMNKLNKVETIQSNCSAKRFYEEGTTKKDWTMIAVSLICSLLSAGIVLAINRSVG